MAGLHPGGRGLRRHSRAATVSRFEEKLCLLDKVVRGFVAVPVAEPLVRARNTGRTCPGEGIEEQLRIVEMFAERGDDLAGDLEEFTSLSRSRASAPCSMDW